MTAQGKAAAEYKEQCKIDRDRGHLADCDFSEGAQWAYRHLSPSPSGWIDEVIKMRDQAAKRVNQLKDADTNDEFSELNYYHGQKVALDQVLSLVKHLLPPPPDSKDL